MPIPYMGSKRDSVGKIYQTILNLNPDKNTIVDLFCGGFAISEYFLKNGWNVIANDKNKYVIALLNKVIFEGLDEKIVLQFITREKFFDIINNPDNYDDWFVGFVRCCWSFGNNQRAYLFGKDVERYKLAGHELVINKNDKLIKELIPDISQKYIDGIMKQDNWHKARIALGKVSFKLKTRIFELERLEQLEQLQQLERLQRLQQLQQLQRTQQLELFSDDYRNIIIPNKAVVYCDPPYIGTAKYDKTGFNHNEFWEWVRMQSKKNRVYVSEYIAPDDFTKVLEFSRRSRLAKKVTGVKLSLNECLFTRL